MSLPDYLMWLDPLLALLNSVFIEDNAEPQTAMLVMATGIGLVFVMLSIPKVKRQKLRVAISHQRAFERHRQA